MQTSNAFSKIYQAVMAVPEGCVATYGQIAAMAGNPRWSRIVGYALHVNPDPQNIKCHRIVFKDGSLTDSFAFGGKSEQRRLLELEGVSFLENGKVDMKKCLFIRSY